MKTLLALTIVTMLGIYLLRYYGRNIGIFWFWAPAGAWGVAISAALYVTAAGTTLNFGRPDTEASNFIQAFVTILMLASIPLTLTATWVKLLRVLL